MKCPNCKTELEESTLLRSYQTLVEHGSNPNATPPLRTFFLCSNGSCTLHENAFWDFYGGYYSENRVGSDWYRKNAVCSYDRSTHKNVGATALDSHSREFDEGYVKNYQGWRNIKRKIRTRWGNWSCELRRKFLPTALWRDNSAWYRRLGYSFGVMVMDFWGQRWKFHVRWKSPEDCQDDFCLNQWLYHPFPWVRWSVRRWLEGKVNLRKT